jgi:hypothetical protein
MTSASAIGSIENDTPIISISLVTMIILKKKKTRVKRDKDYHIYKKEKKNKVVGLLEKKDE